MQQLSKSYMACSVCGSKMRRAKTSSRLGPSVCRPCRQNAAKARLSNTLCVACGDSVRRADCYYCSKGCAARHCDAARWPQCAVPPSHPARKPWPKRGPSTRVFIPDCGICGKTFVTIYTVSTCSPECRKAKHRADHSESKHRRRARKRDAFIAPVSPRKVYERDGWRCHLCRRLVSKTAIVPHPRAATLDHLVPLAAGGTHEPANVATAHFICNALKGDRGGGEQLALIG